MDAFTTHASGNGRSVARIPAGFAEDSEHVALDRDGFQSSRHDDGATATFTKPLQAGGESKLRVRCHIGLHASMIALALTVGCAERALEIEVVVGRIELDS